MCEMSVNPFDLIQILGAALARHVQTPQVTVDAYRQQMDRSVWKSIENKTRVYLDTKHWVHLRDVRLGRPRCDQHVEILERLQQLVSSGRIICPVSFPLIVELTKQGDKTTRRATAKIMDELSGSTCVLSPVEVARLEIERFVATVVLGIPPSDPIETMIWRKPFFMHGDFPFREFGFEVTQKDALQKAYLDQFAAFSIEDTIDMMDARGGFDTPAGMPVDETNRLRKEYAKRPARRQQIFKAQQIAAINENADILARVLESFAVRHPKSAAILTGETAVLDFMKRLLEEMKSAEGQRALPHLHVQAMLRTEIQMDSRRVVKETDWWDVAHASVALPYADIFFFERSFTHLITREETQLDSFYDTQVFADRSMILDCLQNIASTA